MKTIFEIGWDDGELNFSIKGTSYKSLTREQYNEILKLSFYCLKELERIGVKDDYAVYQEK